MRAESARARDGNRLYPELGFFSLFSDVDVGWFIQVGLVEPEPISIYPQYDGHDGSTISRIYRSALRAAPMTRNASVSFR